jgi:hypothetical protein
MRSLRCELVIQRLDASNADKGVEVFILFAISTIGKNLRSAFQVN